MNQELNNEKKILQKDLEFYLEFYKELSNRSPKLKKAIDFEIEKLIQKLKELGK